MKKRIRRIIQAYYTEYVEPLNQQMYPNRQVPFYPEQEISYTDLTHLDPPYGEQSFKERNKLVYPETEWTNPPWAGGDFQSPYENNLLDYFKLSPNDNSTLFDQLKGGSMIEDLGKKSANSIDEFLASGKETIKISSMDLSNFMKVSDDTLIHKSRKDLWKMFKDKKGDIFIQRLFEDDVLGE